MVDVGDVLAVRTRGIFPQLIAFGAKLRGKPAIDHVAIVVSVDPDGATQVIEAEPGGVRVASAASYLADPRTVTNVRQPKTAEQRAQVAAVAWSFLRTPYDWRAIDEDAANLFKLDDPFVHEWLPGSVPTRLVCSSLASYIYHKVGLAEPVGGRFCEPCDWAQWDLDNHFN